MGNQTAGAVFDPCFGIGAISAAPVPQGIQGAVAEQATKVTAVRYLVTGKIFAVLILKKTVRIFHIVTSQRRIVFQHSVLQLNPIQFLQQRSAKQEHHRGGADRLAKIDIDAGDENTPHGSPAEP